MGNAASTLSHSGRENAVVATTDHTHSSTAATHTSSTAAALSSSASPKAKCACSHLHPGRTCLAYVVSSFGRSFYLAYGIRAGISLALHAIKLLRTGHAHNLFDLDELVGAHGLPVDAIRIGLFLGGFTGLYNGMRCLLARLTGVDNEKTVMFAGAVASLSILFQHKDSHRTIALYALARVCQSWYNDQKAKGRFHFYGSDWPHGDTLLFALCTAQVMYAYIMR